MNRSRIVALAALLLLAPGVVASPAVADVSRESYEGGLDPFVSSDCGYKIVTELEFHGTWSVRDTRGGPPVLFSDIVDFRWKYTNAATGEWFSVSGHRASRDVAATLVEGTIYEYTTIEAGQPVVVRDSTGEVILRDRGLVRFRTVFDTSGQSSPRGDFLDFLGLDLRGPHPSFGIPDLVCQVAGDLFHISDSGSRLTPRPAGTTDSPLGYYEYLPPPSGSGEPSPLLVFLHGGGESGDGSADQLGRLLATGIPRAIANNGWPDGRPFIVLAPQHDPVDDTGFMVCDDVEFGGSCAMNLQHELGNPDTGSLCITPTEIDAFLTYALAAYDVDPQRVYLTGLSCGAFGAWEYVAEHGGDTVAATVPIAGEGRPAWDTAGCSLGEAAIWAFHGEADDVVDPAGSIEPIQDLQTCPSPPREDVQLTTYPDVGHDSWTQTYALDADVDIYTWLLSHTLG